MALLLDQITIGSTRISVLDSNPNLVSGYESDVGSIALVPSTAKLFFKTASLDTDWTEVATVAGIAEYAQDAVAAALTNSADIQFAYNDLSDQISATLSASGVVAGTYGNASQSVTVTVDSKGRITSMSAQPISIVASQVSDFSSAVDNVVGIYRATVQTTTNSTTTLLSYTIPSNKAVYVKAYIIGFDTANRAAVYERSAAGRNNAGAVSQVGVTQSDFTEEITGITTANATIDVSGSAIRVRITGVSGSTINWSATVQIVSI
jgi:ABC-type transporter Mla subunit MlaD